MLIYFIFRRVNINAGKQFHWGLNPASVSQEANYEDWLLNGKVDKPVFFVTKIDRLDEYRNHPNLEIIKEENGFVFFKRRNTPENLFSKKNLKD